MFKHAFHIYQEPLLISVNISLLTFNRQPYKMVKHTQTIRRYLPTNCLSVFDQFVWFALKGLTLTLPID